MLRSELIINQNVPYLLEYDHHREILKLTSDNFRLFILLGLSVHMEEVLLVDCKIATLENFDILEGQENNDPVAVLGNTENMVAQENIDILVAALEHIV